ncbi:conserved hypothetical protein [Talaromyces stipitatus ATCC 10500]|uniref:O-methyltransferase n=1 Tax=Talaromyces stipitatus (strain ATCC 10500 / CBS 375.48 / QM 6759 / NRRL 1006) TaxID=441959 RepID=B8MRV6_TALSN|nr:uncharacterized protein TSTA_057790 [Talaromyces stipitatus ATCC 10500]EED13290.1 conserved hypothetical protein [Talaromyces stipitatus ATCC 10500]
MIAVEGGILQELSNRYDEITADQLAEITGRPKLDIVRVLRLLTAIGACVKVGLQRYRANDKTPVLSVEQRTDWGFGGLLNVTTIQLLPSCAITPNLAEYFTDYAKRSMSESNLQSAYSYTYGKDMYDVLRENKERKADLDAYMKALKQEKKQGWHHVYPVMSELSQIGTGDEISPSTIIVDVGAVVVMNLKVSLRAIPSLTPTKGARIYLLLAVFHNLEDAKCRTILKNLSDAMKPGYSLLLILGILVPEIGADRRIAELDIQMWLLQHSRQ